MDFKPYGLIPAMVTPTNKDESLNVPALRKLTNYLIDEGVHGLFPIGTCGESYALSDSEIRTVLETVKDEAKGRVPVYGGINQITTRGAVKMAQMAEEVGVDAISILTPFFLVPDQEEIYEHYKTIAENTSLPIILYNNAPKTHVGIAPSTVAKLAKIDNIISIKDSTGDLTTTEEYIRLTKGENFHVLMGRDTMIYAALCYGASGSIAACGNVAPRMMADIYNKFMAGDLEGAKELQYKVAPLRIAFSIGTFPAVIKAALQMLGIDCGYAFRPAGPLTSDELKQLETILKEVGVL